MADVTKEQIIESIKNMKVMDLVDLVKELEDTFGVVAAAPMAAMPMATAGEAGGAAAAAEEKTSFDVVLTGAGDKKIQVIKVVRSATSLGLKEAKDLVDGAPNPVKTGINKDEAEALKKELEEAGATVELK